LVSGTLGKLPAFSLFFFHIATLRRSFYESQLVEIFVEANHNPQIRRKRSSVFFSFRFRSSCRKKKRKRNQMLRTHMFGATLPLLRRHDHNGRVGRLIKGQTSWTLPDTRPRPDLIERTSLGRLRLATEAWRAQMNQRAEASGHRLRAHNGLPGVSSRPGGFKARRHFAVGANQRKAARGVNVKSDTWL
jgi:hypothetical protein